MKKTVLLTGSTGFLGNLFINNFSKKYRILSVGSQEKHITNDIFQYNIDTLNKNLIDDEFSKILFESMDNKLLSEIYLENTFHYRDTRKKIVPIIVESIKKNMPNPVLNKEEYFNLTYATDVMEVFNKELSVETFSPKSRVTSEKDINIYSIYEFLLKYNNSNLLDKELLKFTDSRYIKNIDIPELNIHYFETDIYKNLLKMFN